MAREFSMRTEYFVLDNEEHIYCRLDVRAQEFRQA